MYMQAVSIATGYFTVSHVKISVPFEAFHYVSARAGQVQCWTMINVYCHPYPGFKSRLALRPCLVLPLPSRYWWQASVAGASIRGN